ncbi:MAG: Rne/Rng family ribonuclease [Desulfuromonadales bacterium]|nr:Rne/Rng family ribonuclease [Desulfuromonadales bacterium]
MSKKMLINALLPEENRVAIVDDGLLSELDIEVAGREQTKGNIYKAVVVRVEPGLQAAFVDYGAERLGFLQIDEINFKTVRPDAASGEGRARLRITDLLHRGQEILVQIVKEERGTKGAALTTYISLAGRYMVLMPDSSTRGVSRKAENDAQRKQLKKAVASLELPDNMGYIVRTAALDQSREELERDSRYLLRLHDTIRQLSAKGKSPALIYKEGNLVIRAIRDYFTTDMDEVLVDDPEVFRETREFFQMVMPDQVELVKLHQEKRPIFSRYQIEEQIETISSNKVNLPSGGSIVIDSTEALVAIDINSGKMSGAQGVEETATRTNLEAAREIGRQLRLRDLGGLIVIDFIDMYERKNIRAVEQELKKSTALDKARINIGRISQFGLLEMSRQRIRATLAAGSYLTCPHCHGMGRIKSPDAMAVNLLRRIHTGVAKGQIGQVIAQLPLDVATYLLNNKREELVDLERRYKLRIAIHGRPDYLTDQVEIEFQKRSKESDDHAEQVAAGMLKSMTEVASAGPEAETTAGVATETAGVEPQPETGESEVAAPAKKRRRRGGRKKSGDAKPAETAETTAAATSGSAADEGEETATGAAATNPEGTDASPETAPTEGTAPATEAVVPGEEADPAEPAKAVKKPRRRRSRRGKGRTGEASPASDSEESGEPLAAVAVTEAAEAAPATESLQAADAQGAAVPATEPAAAQAGDAGESPAQAVESPPKRRRARRTATKKVEQSETADATTPAAAVATATVEETGPVTTDAASKPPAKRASRSRTKKTEPVETAAETAVPAETAQATDETSAPVADKPKTRRTSRAKTKAAETPAKAESIDTATGAADQTTPPATATEKKAASRPRTRRPATAKKTDETAVTEAGKQPAKPRRKPATAKSEEKQE